MSEEKKETKKKLVSDFTIMALAIFITALVAGGGMYLFQAENMDHQRAENDAQIAELQNQISKATGVTTTTKVATKDETATWKTYSNKYFTIKYPTSWVYRDFSALGANGTDSVGFAETESLLAPAQSDASSTVNVAWLSEPMGAPTTETDKLTTETFTTKTGIKGTRYTLAAGRTNDFNGESKQVIYEFKLTNGKYLVLSNLDDAQKTIFDQMVDTTTQI